MHHRHLQVLLQRPDDVERAPAGAEHVDRVGAFRLEEIALDVGVDLVARQLLHLVERHIDPRHAAHGEARVAEIFGEDGVELGREIGGAEDRLGLERLERVHVVLRNAHDRCLVFLLPCPDDLGFALAALHHERRRAVGMNEVAAALGQHRHKLLVGRHHGRELVLRAAPDIEEQRDESDAFRQQADDLFGHARPQGRVDHAHDAAPAGKGHAGNLSFRRCSG